MFVHTVLIVLMLVCGTVANVTLTRGYHDEVGIPLAAMMMRYEETQLNRIADGEVAIPNMYPFLAGLWISLLKVPSHSVCGSALLSSKVLVTAAHCWYDGHKQAYHFLVLLGTIYFYDDGLRIGTKDVIMHPNWQPERHRNDIAIIVLPVNVRFSANISPVSLPSVYELNNLFFGIWATTPGFGQTTDDAGVITPILRHVELLVISQLECQLSFNFRIANLYHLCTGGYGGAGTCYGDSGGPLVTYSKITGKPILIGIGSFVSLKGCRAGLPSVFTRVTNYYNFLMKYIAPNGRRI